MRRRRVARRTARRTMRRRRVVALECSAIPDFEYTALEKLAAGE